MEIIPNWHPIFVHFTVALLSLSVGLFVISHFLQGELRQQWETVARWNLWFGTLISLLTVGAGFYAFNTVRHDEPSHLAMQEHRNWALVTFTWFLVLAYLVYRSYQHGKRPPGTGLLLALVVGAGLLLATAWHGGELVYRHGLGVMSLPQAEEGAGHEHGGAGHGAGGDAAPASAIQQPPGGVTMDGGAATEGTGQAPLHEEGHEEEHDDGHAH